MAPVKTAAEDPASLSDAGFTALVRRLDAAWQVGLAEGLSLYADEAAIRIWDDTPVAQPGKPAYAAAIGPLMDSLASARNEPCGDVTVLRAGDVVITLSLLANRFRFKDGRRADLLNRQTLVWKLVGGRWLIVHEHTSRLPEG